MGSTNLSCVQLCPTKVRSAHHQQGVPHHFDRSDFVGAPDEIGVQGRRCRLANNSKGAFLDYAAVTARISREKVHWEGGWGLIPLKPGLAFLGKSLDTFLEVLGQRNLANGKGFGV